MTDASQAWKPYCGAGPDPAGWLDRWNWDPILIGLTVALLAAGFVRSRATARAQLASGIVVLALFVSPLCALGSALFGFRAAHHLILTLVLAPLLVSATRAIPFRAALPLATATVVQAAVFWAWHVPALYGAALGSDGVFWLMQGSITASAMAWWGALRRASPLAATTSLLATMVQMGVLGALLVFAGRPLFAPHWLTTAAWGLTPLEDQQIAGLVMWVGGGAVYLGLAAGLLYRALAPSPATRPA